MSEARYLFGEWLGTARPLTAADVARACETAESRTGAMAAYPVESVLALFGRMRALWSDPAYARRRRLLETLPAEMGFSPEMVELGLDRLCDLLDPGPLRSKVRTELGRYSRHSGVDVDLSTGTGLHWEPLGVVLHVLSSNGFLGAAGSLIEGLLTGNVNLLKLSSSRRAFLPELVDSLRECDEDGVVARSIALLDYSSSDVDVMRELKTRVDGIVVWGGEQAVRAYRDELPARTKILVFGPKLSLALVTARGLETKGSAEVARELARDVAIWDQSACTAPQLCYVEGEANARRLVEETARELDVIAASLPPGPADDDTAVEIQKVRGLSVVAEARGEGLCRASSGDVGWTVTLARELDVESSPLHRTLRIVPFAELPPVLAALRAMKGYLQTVGVTAAPDERAPLTAALARVGAVRFVDIGTMTGGRADDPHDGAYDLPQLMHLVCTRLSLPSRELHPVDVLPEETRARIIDERLLQLLASARRAPFYRERLATANVRGVRDLGKLPILTRADMEANMPPVGDGLSTGGAFSGGYVTRSGGSTTGEAAFSLYDGADWEQLVAAGMRAFHALGLRRGDRLANCMRAGDLYGGFVSFDHINHRLGATTFGFATAVTPDVLVDIWRKFELNAIQGVPAMIIPLLRAAKELEPALTLEKVLYAGAPMSKADADWLGEALGARRVASVVGANDGGPIAYQCPAMSGALHHALDDYNYLEIVDDHGEPVPDGEAGRLLVTTLSKHAFPLLRYEIGDAGRFLPGPCACGRTTRRLEYLGRSHDKIRLGAFDGTYGDFRRALDALPLSEVQLLARRDERGDRLVVRVETGAVAPALQDAILASLAAAFPTLDDDAVTVEVYASGALPRNPRSSKLKAFIDERTRP